MTTFLVCALWRSSKVLEENGGRWSSVGVKIQHYMKLFKKSSATDFPYLRQNQFVLHLWQSDISLKSVVCKSSTCSFFKWKEIRWQTEHHTGWTYVIDLVQLKWNISWNKEMKSTLNYEQYFSYRISAFWYCTLKLFWYQTFVFSLLTFSNGGFHPLYSNKSKMKPFSLHIIWLTVGKALYEWWLSY